MKPREDTHLKDSAHSGLRGWYERLLRRHERLILTVTLLVFYVLIALLLGLAAAPGIRVALSVIAASTRFSPFLEYPLKGFALFLGYLIYGFTAIVLIPLPNLIVLRFLKPFRGPYLSTAVFAWYVHNILTYSIRYTFLDWITPTPFNLFFYRFMGMKIGERTEINSSNISDPGLIELEDDVTIGGSATIIAHYAMGGYLVIAPVIVRKNATIGLRATILGGVEIGQGAKVLPNSMVLPKTIIPAGETWGGVPASRIDSNHQA